MVMIYHGFRIRRKSTKSQQIQVNYSLIREASDQKILDLWGQQIIQGLPQKRKYVSPLKANMTMENHHLLIGDTSSNGSNCPLSFVSFWWCVHGHQNGFFFQ